MGVKHENRVKQMYQRAARAKIDRAIELEALRRGPSDRRTATQVKASLPPSKAKVRRWMRLHADEYESATALVEGCNGALDLPQIWLDDPGHWIWDLAVEVGP